MRKQLPWFYLNIMLERAQNLHPWTLKKHMHWARYTYNPVRLMTLTARGWINSDAINRFSNVLSSHLPDSCHLSRYQSNFMTSSSYPEKSKVQQKSIDELVWYNGTDLSHVMEDAWAKYFCLLHRFFSQEVFFIKVSHWSYHLSLASWKRYKTKDKMSFSEWNNSSTLSLLQFDWTLFRIFHHK